MRYTAATPKPTPISASLGRERTACSRTAAPIKTIPNMNDASRRSRLRNSPANIRANPKVAMVADRYDEDWSKLGWVMIQGEAEILESGDLHDAAQTELRARYPQLRTMHLSHLPVVAIRIAHVISWGRLDASLGRQES